MKIKVAICTTDIRYSDKVVNYFQNHYYDKFTWNVFTEPSYLFEFIGENDTDLILIGLELMPFEDRIKADDSKEHIWAYLVDVREDEEWNYIYQVEKYSRADKLYRDLLELYSHKSNIYHRNEEIVNSRTEIYAFVSAAGGVGVSTVACAVVRGFGRYEKVLYISLENISAIPIAFHGEKKAGFDEVVFALKSRRKALDLKLASSVSHDKSGVYFFEPCSNALDIIELTQDDLKELLSAIQQLNEYDKVIVDVGNSLEEKAIAAMLYSRRVVVIVENEEASLQKFDRYIEALKAVEERRETDICSKMILFYNKALKQAQTDGQRCGVRVMGGFPQIENGNYEGIIERLSQMELIHNIK